MLLLFVLSSLERNELAYSNTDFSSVLLENFHYDYSDCGWLLLTLMLASLSLLLRLELELLLYCRSSSSRVQQPMRLLLAFESNSDCCLEHRFSAFSIELSNVSYRFDSHSFDWLRLEQMRDCHNWQNLHRRQKHNQYSSRLIDRREQITETFASIRRFIDEHLRRDDGPIRCKRLSQICITVFLREVIDK